jgi:hypothetical protein
MFSSNDRIQYLEKELSVFREEAVRLYDRIEQKKLEEHVDKIKIKELLQEK